MDVKKFILSSIVGAVVFFALGALFYGFLFTKYFPSSEDTCYLFYFLGSLSFAVLLSYIFNKWAGIYRWDSGAKAGALIALLTNLYFSFFYYSDKPIDYTTVLIDFVSMIIIGAITGAVVAMLSAPKE